MIAKDGKQGKYMPIFNDAMCEMIAKDGKQGKYIPIFNDTMCDDYLIINLN